MDKARAFQALHRSGQVFIMPNAWDAGSAHMLAAGGFAALGTTSAGIAFSMGWPDGDPRMTRSRMLDRVHEIASAVGIPVSADLESGYGATPEEVGETIRLSIEAGVVGANIEDATGDPARPLYEPAEAVDRLRAARETADKLRDRGERPYTLTARIDTFLAGTPEPLRDAIDRAQLYRAAGADCIFVPGIRDEATIETLVRHAGAPLTVVMGLTGTTLSAARLGELGVRRISIGGSLARATYGLIRRAALEMHTTGTFEFARDQIPDAELCQFFAYTNTTGPAS